MRRKSQISLRDLALTQDLKQLVSVQRQYKCSHFFFSSEGEDIVLHDISPMEHIIVFIFHFLHSISSHLVKRTPRLRRACVTFI